MSTLKVGAIRGVSASSDAITVANDGTCTANITNKSNRNLIINGAMQVAQRATSSTALGYVTLDRFLTGGAGLDENPTYAQVDVDSSVTPYTLGFKKAAKITNGNQTSGAGAGDIFKINQRIEAQDLATSGWNFTSASSFITLSFWVRSSVAQTFFVRLQTKDGTNQNFPFSYTVSANTWTKVTKAIPGNSNIQIDNNNDTGLDIEWTLFRGTDMTDSSVTLDAWAAFAAGTREPDNTSTWYTTNDATWELTGVQLEVGSVATDFEHRSFAQELALCQRYCCKWHTNGASTNNHSRFLTGYYGSSTSGVFFLTHPVSMRATDGRTLTHNINNIESLSGGGTSNNLALLSDGNSNMITGLVVNNLSGVTQFDTYVARVSAQTNWFIIIANEL